MKPREKVEETRADARIRHARDALEIEPPRMAEDDEKRRTEADKVEERPMSDIS
jgi:hypothetical protein